MKTSIISIEETKRGASQFSVKSPNGEVFIIGFDSNAPKQESERYSTFICSIMDDFEDTTGEDMFTYFTMQMTRAKLETPLFIMADHNEGRARIGKKIRMLRVERKIDSKTLAQMAGVDPANLSRIESGKLSAGLDTLSKIAMALDSKVDIVPNRPKEERDSTMGRHLWVLFTGNFCALAAVPPYSCFYWPVTQHSGIRIGDYVVPYQNNKQIGPCFIVAETHVERKQWIEERTDVNLPPHHPKTDARIFMKLNYAKDLTSTEEAIIIERAKEQISNRQQDLTLLQGDIL